MKLLNIILSSITIIVLFMALSLAIYSIHGIKKIEVKQLAEAQIKHIKEENTMLPLVNYDRIIVNLESTPRRLKYLSFDLSLSPINGPAVELLQNKNYLINDIAIYEASKMDSDELVTVMGKTILESRIRNKINDSFNFPVVKRIYFDQFVIQ